jgi:hypothetical protein
LKKDAQKTQIDQWEENEKGPATKEYHQIPSGKRLHNYRRPPFFMGKFTINGPFSIEDHHFL